jgi:hypothetical protein
MRRRKLRGREREEGKDELRIDRERGRAIDLDLNLDLLFPPLFSAPFSPRFFSRPPLNDFFDRCKKTPRIKRGDDKMGLTYIL